MSPTHRTDSVLRHKIARGRGANPQAHATGHAAPASLPRALRRAVARAGEHELGLRISVLEVVEGTDVSLAELVERPEAGALLAVLEGPGEDLGLIAWSAELTEGVLQQQTTGAVHPPLGTPRRPTRTDAAMSAGLIDRIMRELEGLLSRALDLGWGGGYRYASYLEEARTLGLLLEDVAYRCFSMRVEIGEGQRGGEMLLALPCQRQAGRRAGGTGQDDAQGEGATDPDARPWGVLMEQAIMACPAQLDAVLDRPRIPLSRIVNWRPGDVVALPSARLDHVVLNGAGGRRLAQGRLGQSRGARALRLSEVMGVSDAPERAEPASPSLSADVAQGGLSAEPPIDTPEPAGSRLPSPPGLSGGAVSGDLAAIAAPPLPDGAMSPVPLASPPLPLNGD